MIKRSLNWSDNSTVLFIFKKVKLKSIELNKFEYGLILIKKLSEQFMIYSTGVLTVQYSSNIVSYLFLFILMTSVILTSCFL